MGTIALKTETTIYAWALLTNHALILLPSGAFGLPNYMRRVGIREKSDERILGSGQFVEKLMREADPTRKKQFRIRERHNNVITMIKDVCKHENIR